MAPKTDTGGREYPTCLERPDLAGCVRVRTPGTEAAYRKRYAGLCKRVEHPGNDERAARIAQVARRLVQAAPTLRPTSYRQYRAAIHQELRDLFDLEEISLDQIERVAESMLLRRADGQPSPFALKRGPLRTSAGRAKSIGEGKASALSAIASARRSPTGANLADQLKYGPKYGLRNSEWPGAVLDGTALKIPCGKYSIPNGRAVAEYRTLLVQDLEPAELRNLASFLQRLKSEVQKANGRSDLVMRRQGHLLRTIRDDVGAPRTTLRTLRHQCTANLRKAGYSREEKAAALGHASADTADNYYGKTNRGWRGLRRWIEVPEELTQKVRPGAKTASKIQRGLPLTRSEWAAGNLPVPGF